MSLRIVTHLLQDALLDPLLNLLSHPNHSVRINTAWALRCFCYSTPLRLPKVLLSVVEKLQRRLVKAQKRELLAANSNGNVHDTGARVAAAS